MKFEIKRLKHDNTRLEDILHDKSKGFEESKRQAIEAQCKQEEQASKLREVKSQLKESEKHCKDLYEQLMSQNNKSVERWEDM